MISFHSVENSFDTGKNCYKNKAANYGIRLSHIFEIPSISNEKPGISIKIPSI